MNPNNKRSFVAAFTALALSSMVSLSASAQEPNVRTGDFGAKGQISVNVDLPFTSDAPQLALYHSSDSMNGDRSTTFSIAPALDYFVAPNISLGAKIGYNHESFTKAGAQVSTITTGFVLGVRGGINIPINQAFSFWPRLSLTYSSVSGGGLTDAYVPLGIFLPVLWHPASHFFLGLGPVFVTDLSATEESQGQSVDIARTTDIGIQAVIGGYFGT